VTGHLPARLHRVVVDLELVREVAYLEQVLYLGVVDLLDHLPPLRLFQHLESCFLLLQHFHLVDDVPSSSEDPSLYEGYKRPRNLKDRYKFLLLNAQFNCVNSKLNVNQKKCT
jgi:hypothetical protein